MEIEKSLEDAFDILGNSGPRILPTLVPIDTSDNEKENQVAYKSYEEKPKDKEDSFLEEMEQELKDLSVGNYQSTNRTKTGVI